MWCGPKFLNSADKMCWLHNLGMDFWSSILLFQLDFQLPARFKLSYSAEDENKTETPVMIHRAILGSVERMFAILLEHYKGKWPFWLSPRQAIVCPVSDKSLPYALEVSCWLCDKYETQKFNTSCLFSLLFTPPLATHSFWFACMWYADSLGDCDPYAWDS